MPQNRKDRCTSSEETTHRVRDGNESPQGGVNLKRHSQEPQDGLYGLARKDVNAVGNKMAGTTGLEPAASAVTGQQRDVTD